MSALGVKADEGKGFSLSSFLTHHPARASGLRGMGRYPGMSAHGRQAHTGHVSRVLGILCVLILQIFPLAVTPKPFDRIQRLRSIFVNVFAKRTTALLGENDVNVVMRLSAFPSPRRRHSSPVDRLQHVSHRTAKQNDVRGAAQDSQLLRAANGESGAGMVGRCSEIGRECLHRCRPARNEAQEVAGPVG